MNKLLGERQEISMIIILSQHDIHRYPTLNHP
jgi:hypothetical protein